VRLQEIRPIEISNDYYVIYYDVSDNSLTHGAES
jgi:hypothetical protein